MKSRVPAFIAALFLCTTILARPAHLADYDAEPRTPNGRVDIDFLTHRLQELHVNTYYWLIAHAGTDWDDLKLFLPKAAAAHIQVWAYLVPPTESAPVEGSLYPEPFRLDYKRWAEEIARLSLQYPNLTGWVIDDFFYNERLYTPAYIAAMQQRSKAINPKLTFCPLMYFPQIERLFVEQYGPVIDGVVVAYPQDRDEIDHAWAILNDRASAIADTFSYPGNTTSQPGEFASASCQAVVRSRPKHILHFRERDNYTGSTAGYHFKQLLVDDTVVWEQDVAGGSNGWQDVSIDVTEQTRGKKSVEMAFRLFDKQSVGNFGVRWEIRDLKGDGLKLAENLRHPEKWASQTRGAFESGFGKPLTSPQKKFHIPFIVMTAAQDVEFKMRHGDPATPERIASWLDMCLHAYHDGKADGVVTYCLDKSEQSREFPLDAKLFREFR